MANRRGRSAGVVLAPVEADADSTTPAPPEVCTPL